MPLAAGLLPPLRRVDGESAASSSGNTAALRIEASEAIMQYNAPGKPAGYAGKGRRKR